VRGTNGRDLARTSEDEVKIVELTIGAELHDGGLHMGYQLRRRRREVAADQIDEAGLVKLVVA
jgi:hypothetical protein